MQLNKNVLKIKFIFDVTNNNYLNYSLANCQLLTSFSHSFSIKCIWFDRHNVNCKLTIYYVIDHIELGIRISAEVLTGGRE